MWLQSVESVTYQQNWSFWKHSKAIIGLKSYMFNAPKFKILIYHTYFRYIKFKYY